MIPRARAVLCSSAGENYMEPFENPRHILPKRGSEQDPDRRFPFREAGRRACGRDANGKREMWTSKRQLKTWKEKTSGKKGQPGVDGNGWNKKQKSGVIVIKYEE